MHVDMILVTSLKVWSFTGFSAMHSSSHLIVRSTEVLFLFSDTHVGTSSAKVVHILGLKEEINSTYSTGLIYKHIKRLHNQSPGSP